MGKKLFLAVIILTVIYAFNGCDMGIESKAVSTGIAPSLVSPAYDETSVSLTPVFSWSGDATKFEIATNSAFTNVLYSANVSGSSFAIPENVLQPYTTYYWRAGYDASYTTLWSESVYRFTTGGN